MLFWLTTHHAYEEADKIIVEVQHICPASEYVDTDQVAWKKNFRKVHLFSFYCCRKIISFDFLLLFNLLKAFFFFNISRAISFNKWLLSIEYSVMNVSMYLNWIFSRLLKQSAFWIKQFKGLTCPNMKWKYKSSSLRGLFNLIILFSFWLYFVLLT